MLWLAGVAGVGDVMGEGEEFTTYMRESAEHKKMGELGPAMTSVSYNLHSS